MPNLLDQVTVNIESITFYINMILAQAPHKLVEGTYYFIV